MGICCLFGIDEPLFVHHILDPHLPLLVGPRAQDGEVLLVSTAREGHVELNGSAVPFVETNSCASPSISVSKSSLLTLVVHHVQLHVLRISSSFKRIEEMVYVALSHHHTWSSCVLHVGVAGGGAIWSAALMYLMCL